MKIIQKLSAQLYMLFIQMLLINRLSTLFSYIYKKKKPEVKPINPDYPHICFTKQKNFQYSLFFESNTILFHIFYLLIHYYTIR